MVEITDRQRYGRRQSVQGQVVDPTGRHVTGALVRVLVQGRGGVTRLAQGVSGADGSYQFELLIPTHVANSRHALFVEVEHAGSLVSRSMVVPQESNAASSDRGSAVPHVGLILWPGDPWQGGTRWPSRHGDSERRLALQTSTARPSGLRVNAPLPRRVSSRESAARQPQ